MVELRAVTTSGWVQVDRAVLDSSGCARWIVPAAYRNTFLQVWIDYTLYGNHYDGGSNGDVWAIAAPWQQWYSFPFQGMAWPGDDGWWWFLPGYVNCTRHESTPTPCY